MPARFRLLAAIDGSPSAHAALATALKFPWPQASRARAVVALGRVRQGTGAALQAATVRVLHEQLEPARRLLARRWPDADARAIHDVPVAAILGEARRFGAGAIALGWRGQGTFRRLLAGSVSRAVVAQARAPVLVVRHAADRVHRLVVGFDGSAEAQRAVRFLARLEPRPGSVAILVSVMEPLWIPRPTRRLPPSVRASLRREAIRHEQKLANLARKRLDTAVSILKRAGWSARSELRAGAPLETLLAACTELHGDVLTVGARRAGGLARALLGSVATGALNHSRVPVLLVP
jgi:nucleotide-binding universal stress UspA family protein